MKKLNNLAALQLTKAQMTQIRGGDMECEIEYINPDDSQDAFTEKGTVGGATDTVEAARIAGYKYIEMGYILKGIEC